MPCLLAQRELQVPSERGVYTHNVLAFACAPCRAGSGLSEQEAKHRTTIAVQNAVLVATTAGTIEGVAAKLTSLFPRDACVAYGLQQGMPHVVDDIWHVVRIVNHSEDEMSLTDVDALAMAVRVARCKSGTHPIPEALVVYPRGRAFVDMADGEEKARRLVIEACARVLAIAMR